MSSFYRKFYFLVSKIYKDKQEQEEYKDQLVREVSHGRTSSLKELNYNEYKTLITRLEETLFNIDIKKARSATLTLMQSEFNIPTYDWDAVDAFCLNPRIMGKRFYDITIKEHTQLRRRLHSILNKGGLKPRTPKKETNTIYIINPKTKVVN